MLNMEIWSDRELRKAAEARSPDYMTIAMSKAAREILRERDSASTCMRCKHADWILIGHSCGQT